MKHVDEIGAANERKWQAEVRKGGGHTIPFLDLDVEELRRFIRGEAGGARLVGRLDPRRYVSIGPASLLAGVEGKDVLCLSAGGG